MDADKKEFDLTEKVSLLRPQIDIDDDEWQARQKEREVRDAVEDFWDHLPNRNRAEYRKNSLIKFEDMLVIDEKGVTPDKCPHIFVDFGSKGPFSGSFEFFEVRRGYGDPEQVPLQGFTRVSEEFAAPTIGTVHAEGAVQLDSDTHRLLVNGNEGIKEYCVTDDRYAFLNVRDVFTLKNARDNSLKYFQVTHTKSTTVREHFTGPEGSIAKSDSNGSSAKS